MGVVTVLCVVQTGDTTCTVIYVRIWLNSHAMTKKLDRLQKDNFH